MFVFVVFSDGKHKSVAICDAVFTAKCPRVWSVSFISFQFLYSSDRMHVIRLKRSTKRIKKVA